jgi:hypothetical protein
MSNKADKKSALANEKTPQWHFIMVPFASLLPFVH